MKKTTHFFIILLLVGFSTFAPQYANAQKIKGQTVVTAGAGYSLVGLFMGAISTGLNTIGDVNSTKTPVIIGGLDYGITDHFSLGAVYTYQGVSANYNSYTDYDTLGPVTIQGSFTDRITRQSIGVRPLFHFGESEKLDLYTGARFSYVWWNYKSDGRTDLSSSDIFEGFGSPIKPQAIFGMRYNFMPALGFNAEFAIGSTYYMMVGINARFGKK